MSPQPLKDVNPQPGQFWKPGLRYRENMGGAIAAIHDLVVANGGVPKYYQSNWGGLIAAIRDLGLTLGSGGGSSSSSVVIGVTPPAYGVGTPAGPGGVPPAVSGGWQAGATKPKDGTLWFDERQGRLMVWAGGTSGQFYQTNGAESLVHVGDDPPKDANGNLLERTGQLWFDTRQGRTFVFIKRSSLDKEWYQLNGGEGHSIFVEPHRLWRYLVTPADINFTEDVSKTFGTIADTSNLLGTVNTGDFIRGMTSNGGGIVETSPKPYKLATLGYNGSITVGESIGIGAVNAPGTPSGFTATALDPTLTYTFNSASKQLTFNPGQVPKEIVVGYYLTNLTSNSGGTVGRILDLDGDGIPETVELSNQNFIADLSANTPLKIKSYQAKLAVIGDMWYRTDTAEIAVYDGNTWVVIGGSGGGASVTIANTAPGSSDVALVDGTFDTTIGNGQLWYDTEREVTYVSVDKKWQPISDRKYFTSTLKANRGAKTTVYETTDDIHAFFVDYVVFDQVPPQIINSGRLLVYHVGTDVQITNTMAQGASNSGLYVDLGVHFTATINSTAGKISLECVCNNDPAVNIPAPQIQLAVSKWVDPA